MKAHNDFGHDWSLSVWGQAQPVDPLPHLLSSRQLAELRRRLDQPTKKGA